MWVHRRESIQPATSSTQCAWCQERNYLLFHVIPSISLWSELEQKASIPRLKQWWRARSYTANDTGQAGWNIGHVRANCQHHGLCKLSVFNCRHLTLHYYVLVLCLFNIQTVVANIVTMADLLNQAFPLDNLSRGKLLSWQLYILNTESLIIIWQCLV